MQYSTEQQAIFNHDTRWEWKMTSNPVCVVRK